MTVAPVITEFQEIIEITESAPSTYIHEDSMSQSRITSSVCQIYPFQCSRHLYLHGLGTPSVNTANGPTTISTSLSNPGFIYITSYTAFW